MRELSALSNSDHPGMGRLGLLRLTRALSLGLAILAGCDVPQAEDAAQAEDVRSGFDLSRFKKFVGRVESNATQDRLDIKEDVPVIKREGRLLFDIAFVGQYYSSELKRNIAEESTELLGEISSATGLKLSVDNVTPNILIIFGSYEALLDLLAKFDPAHDYGKAGVLALSALESLRRAAKPALCAAAKIADPATSIIAVSLLLAETPISQDTAYVCLRDAFIQAVGVLPEATIDYIERGYVADSSPKKGFTENETLAMKVLYSGAIRAGEQVEDISQAQFEAGLSAASNKSAR